MLKSNSKSLKAKVLSIMLTVMTLATINLQAQNDGSRGLFGFGPSSNNVEYNTGSRGMMNISGNSEEGISNYGIGEEVPLGSGLLILSLAGAGYAALRRKRSRKGTALLLVCALLLGFTQCKKEHTLEPNQNEGVRITLTVDGGNNNGSRVVVDPDAPVGYATVTFENGDVIYVGYNNAYVGTLTYTDGTFSGEVSIAEVVDSQPLHFYFLGGKGFTPTVSGNTASVVISDQTSKYPVISYAPSKEKYTGTGSYSAKLQNKCSIMKFNVTTPSNSPICITGMNNKVTVNFSTPSGTDNGFGFSANAADGGLITLSGDGSGEKWAIVLPQDAVCAGDAYSDNYDYYGTRPSLSAISANQYINEGVNIALNAPEGTPLTFEAKTAGAIVSFSSTMVTPPTIEYSLNGGEWTTYSSSITLTNIGDKVSFRGNNAAYASSYNEYSAFSCTKDCYVYGNIMSLISKEGFASATSLTKNYAFCRLFYNNTHICSHASKTLALPATTLTEWCYYLLFRGCSNLTKAPELPATTLADYCYMNMFGACSGLVTAPELPATNLAKECYTNMFNNCTQLKVAPALPATTMAYRCYYCMFSGCTGLTAAPTLPAMTLATACYYGMFLGCTGLTSAPALPATTLEEQCYWRLFAGCSNLVSAPALPATTMKELCYYEMFSGCSNLETPPALPATTIAESCYGYMFWDCTGLQSAPALPATSMARQCYYAMFSGCTSLSTPPALPATTLAEQCYGWMFANCTSLTSSPVLSVASLYKKEYFYMFKGCSSLSTVTCLATYVGGSGVSNWMDDVAESGTFYKAASSSIFSAGGSYGPPSGWTVVNYSGK